MIQVILTSLLLMGRPRRRRESASLLTRDPVPEAFSTAEATNGLDTVDGQSSRFCSDARKVGAVHRDTVMAAVEIALTTQLGTFEWLRLAESSVVTLPPCIFEGAKPMVFVGIIQQTKSVVAEGNFMV